MSQQILICKNGNKEISSPVEGKQIEAVSHYCICSLSGLRKSCFRLHQLFNSLKLLEESERILLERWRPKFLLPRLRVNGMC